MARLRARCGVLFGVLVAQAAGALEHVAFVDTFITAAGTLSYLLGAVALFQHPRVPAEGRRLLVAALDVGVVATSLGVIQWYFVHQSAARSPRELLWVTTYALAQLFMVSGLTVVVALGRATPSTRATWLFMTSLACYVPVTVFGQVAVTNGSDRKSTRLNSSH